MANTTDRKTAIVTGGGGAIGGTVALTMAENDYDLAIWDVEEATARATAEKVGKTGARVTVHALDLTDDEAIEEAANATHAAHGSIDVLVNNAGIFGLTPIVDLDLAYWDRVMAINLRAPVVCVRACVPTMIAQRSGCIINISSISAVVARQDNLAYAAAKAALLRVTQDLALDLAPYGIRANSITPGSTDTPMIRNYDDPDAMRQAMLNGSLEKFRIGIPLKRLAMPEDHAAAIAFLVSDKARHITGQNIVIDGGQTLA
jgi:2,3-dihydro-2,3-dihydroxybenzoate dehydrogenase